MNEFPQQRQKSIEREWSNLCRPNLWAVSHRDRGEKESDGGGKIWFDEKWVSHCDVRSRIFVNYFNTLYGIKQI